MLTVNSLKYIMRDFNTLPTTEECVKAIDNDLSLSRLTTLPLQLALAVPVLKTLQ